MVTCKSVVFQSGVRVSQLLYSVDFPKLLVVAFLCHCTSTMFVAVHVPVL